MTRSAASHRWGKQPRRRNDGRRARGDGGAGSDRRESSAVWPAYSPTLVYMSWSLRLHSLLPLTTIHWHMTPILVRPYVLGYFQIPAVVTFAGVRHACKVDEVRWPSTNFATPSGPRLGVLTRSLLRCDHSPQVRPQHAMGERVRHFAVPAARAQHLSPPLPPLSYCRASPSLGARLEALGSALMPPIQSARVPRGSEEFFMCSRSPALQNYQQFPHFSMRGRHSSPTVGNCIYHPAGRCWSGDRG